MTPEQKQTLNDLLTRDAIQTIWLVLDHYRDQVLEDSEEESEEWQEICEAMARIEEAI
jgi:hypothetical protein